MRRKTLIKAVVGLVALGLLGTLFVRSAMDVGAEPYTLSRDPLARWTVALDPAPDVSGVLLALFPPETLGPPLFKQIFRRSGVSLSGPDPVALPLVLTNELSGGAAGAVSPDSLLALARDTGLESMPPKPLCLASRRVSQPGLTRDVFFVRFEHPSFADFRLKVAAQLGAAGAGFDPASLSPILIVAATDSNFASWLPLQGGATQDCLAPIVEAGVS